MKLKLQERLKTEGSSFGFNEDEIKQLTDLLSGGLTDESSEEDLASVVKQGLSIMKLSQSAVNRSVNKIKTPVDKKVEKPIEKPIDKSKGETSNEVLELLKGLSEEIQALKGANVKKSRKERLNDLYKGLPKEDKERLLTQIELVEFPNDEAFEQFIEVQKPSIDALVAKVGADKVNSLAKPKTSINTDKLPSKEEAARAFNIKLKE